MSVDTPETIPRVGNRLLFVGEVDAGVGAAARPWSSRKRARGAASTPRRWAPSLANLLGVVGVSASFGALIVTTAMIGTLAVVTTGCLGGAEARHPVGLLALLAIAAAFGPG